MSFEWNRKYTLFIVCFLSLSQCYIYPKYPVYYDETVIGISLSCSRQSQGPAKVGCLIGELHHKAGVSWATLLWKMKINLIFHSKDCMRNCQCQTLSLGGREEKFFSETFWSQQPEVMLPVWKTSDMLMISY